MADVEDLFLGDGRHVHLSYVLIAIVKGRYVAKQILECGCLVDDEKRDVIHPCALHNR